MQLQNIRYVEKESMHIAKMTELRERLAKMNAPVSEESFISYIRTSLSLASSFRSIYTTLSATAHQTGKKLTSANVFWNLTEEAMSIKIENNINKTNAAMLVATSKTKWEKGKGKNKSAKSSKDNKQCTSTNCG